jgi:DNA-binding NtrC family response regulator
LKNIIDSNQNNSLSKPLDIEKINLKKMSKNVKDRAEKRIISYVLEQTNWNKSPAAKILKISYKTLLYKIADFDITPQKSAVEKIIEFPKSDNLEHFNSEPFKQIHF